MSKATRSKTVLSRIAFETIENRLLLSAGDLDLNFGAGGYADIPIVGPSSGNWAQYTEAMAIQSDGKILIGGENNTMSAQYYLAVARTTVDGALDASFAGGNGSLSFDTTVAVGQDLMVGLAVGDQDSILNNNDYQDYIYVIANYAAYSGVFVVRLTPDGALDDTFGADSNGDGHGDGFVNVPNLQLATACTLKGDALYIAGTVTGNGGSDIAVTKLDLDGNVDAAFGNTGYVYTLDNDGYPVSQETVPGLAVYNLDYAEENAFSILAQGDGNIVVAGQTSGEIFNEEDQSYSYGASWIIGRFTALGAADVSFGGVDGFQTFSTGGESDYLSSLVETENHTLIAGGTWAPNGVLSCSLAAFSETDGSLLGTTCFVPAGYDEAQIDKLTLDSDGYVIAAGSAKNLAAVNVDILVARFSPDLSPDGEVGVRTFGHDVGSQIMERNIGVVVQPSTGRIIAGTGAYYWHFALYGVQGAGSVTPTNTTPIAYNPADQTIDEGDIANFSGSFYDPDMGDSWTYAWNVSINYLGLDVVIAHGDTLDYSYRPYDDGVYKIEFQVTDAAGAHSEGYGTLYVNNVAPTPTIALPATSALNAPVNITITSQDPGLNDTQTVSWSITNPAGAEVYVGSAIDSGSGVQISYTPIVGGTYTVSVTVDDGDGGVTTTSSTFYVFHAPTVAPIAGQTVNEGDTVALAGAFVDPDPGDSWTYAWSVAASNGQSIAAGTGLNYSFVPYDNGDYTVTFTVTDSQGTSGNASGTITALNAAPTASVAGPSAAPLFTATQYTVSISDPGSNDTQTVAWKITDSTNAIIASGAGTLISFTPSAAGNYVVSATVTDDDGAASTATKTVSVSPMVVVGTELIIGSGNASNTIIISRSAGQISAYLDGSTSSFSGLNHITVYCGAGTDIVVVNPSLGVACDVYGGDGNDILSAGSGGDMLLGENGNDLLLGMDGADILIGGNGNDLISGGDGNDLIIGGHGSDLLLGNADQDILVAGTTSYDNNPAALKAIVAEWSSPRTYTQRVKNLTDGTGTSTRLNGAYFLAVDVTVFDDGARDSLAGNSGTDWFIFNADAGVRDLLIDRTTAESAFDVDVLR